MKEFNVRVESMADFRIIAREEAIREAKRQIKCMIDKGYTKKQIWVNFYHEETNEPLGCVELIDQDNIQLINVDNRIATIRALLSK